MIVYDYLTLKILKSVVKMQSKTVDYTKFRVIAY